MTFKAAYNFTFDKFLTLVRARRERAGVRVWRRYLVIFGIYALSMWWFGGLGSKSAWTAEVWYFSMLWFIAGGVATGMIIALIDLVFDRLVYRLIFRRYAQAGKRIAVDIGMHGLTASGAGVSAILDWQAIKQMTVMRDSSAAVLWLSNIEGILVPADAFASTSEFAAACQFMKEKTDAR